MATIYSVQTFVLKGGKLAPDAVKPFRSEESALATAERLAASKAGVVAFSQEVDVGTDTYDDPKVLFKAGKLPPGLFE